MVCHLQNVTNMEKKRFEKKKQPSSQNGKSISLLNFPGQKAA